MGDLVWWRYLLEIVGDESLYRASAGLREL
jgi:hypothetical protein